VRWWGANPEAAVRLVKVKSTSVNPFWAIQSWRAVSITAIYSSENKRKLSADENRIRVLSQYDDSKRSDLADRKNEKKNLVVNELTVNESDLEEKGKKQNNLEYSKCNGNFIILFSWDDFW